MLPDAAAGQIEWRLVLSGSDGCGSGALSALFTASQGSFGAFTFIDPLANLARMERRSFAAGLAGRIAAERSRRDRSAGNAKRVIDLEYEPGSTDASQTLGSAGDYVACFSVYLRSDAAGTVTLQRDGTQ